MCALVDPTHGSTQIQSGIEVCHNATGRYPLIQFIMDLNLVYSVKKARFLNINRHLDLSGLYRELLMMSRYFY